MKEKSLDLTVRQIEYKYDEYDTNAIIFLTDNGYFCIQRSVAIDPDDDPLFRKSYIELDSQENGDYHDFQEVLFSHQKILIIPALNFLEKYSYIIINMLDEVDKKMIDFFVNHLFLGKEVKFTEHVNPTLRVKQTKFPEEL